MAALLLLLAPVLSAVAAPNRAGPNAVKKEALAALADKLTDPDSARFKGAFVDKSGAVCGEFNAKNKVGGYVGFRRFLVNGPHVLMEGSYEESLFIRRWDEFCTGKPAPVM